MIQQRRLAQQQMQQQQQQQFQQQQQPQQQQPQQQQPQQQQLPPPPPQPPIPQQTQQQQHNPQQQQRPNMSNPSLGGLAGHTPSQLQMTPQSQNSLVAGGIDPRTGGPSLTTMQIQQQLSALSPHQRQLFLMQQQQHRQHQQQQQQSQAQPQQQQLPARNSGINSSLGPSGLITQQFGGGGTIPGNLPTTAALLHQRHQQARLQQQAQQQAQLGEAAAFAATGQVSSNTGIPGIARSTRSPSDSTHSPLTPRAQQQLQQLQQQQQSQSQQQPSQGMEYQRALMMDTARGQVGSPAPGPGFANAQPLAGTFGAGIGASINTGAMANTNGSYSVSPPGSAHSRTSFPGTAAAPSPSATSSGNWQTGGTTVNANGGWQSTPGAASMGGGIGSTMGLDPGTFAYGDTQAFGTDGLVMDPMADPPGIEFNDIFNIPG